MTGLGEVAHTLRAPGSTPGSPGEARIRIRARGPPDRVLVNVNRLVVCGGIFKTCKKTEF